MNITNYLKAGFPALYILTPEESRAEMCIHTTASELKRKIIYWSVTTGTFEIAHNGKKSKLNEELTNPVEALDYIMKTGQESAKGDESILFVCRDIHPYLEQPRIRRQIRDIVREFKQLQQCLIMVSPVCKIPEDINRDITVIEFVLPTRADLTTCWNVLYTPYKAKLKISEEEQDAIISAAMGLTSTEAEAAFAKAMVDNINNKDEKKPTISRLVLREKSLAVRKTGLLEYLEATENLNDIGGLDNLKTFLTERSKSFTKKAREFGLPPPRGIVLLGLPGCGKSLSAKVASNILNIPLIKLDIGKCMGGIVGQSEANIRAATQFIDGVGSCVVWLDEMEKAFAGTGGSGNLDSGVTLRVFGHFLTWMQEKTTPSFVIATVNKIDNILANNPELLRKGRFDELFYVGLPSGQERKHIFEIHIKDFRKGKTAAELGIDTVALAKKSEGFSGAEIKECVISSLNRAFHKDSELTTDFLMSSVLSTNPLSKSAETQLANMKKWAESNAIPASIPEEKSGNSGFSRKMDF